MKKLTIKELEAKHAKGTEDLRTKQAQVPARVFQDLMRSYLELRNMAAKATDPDLKIRLLKEARMQCNEAQNAYQNMIRAERVFRDTSTQESEGELAEALLKLAEPLP